MVRCSLEILITEKLFLNYLILNFLNKRAVSILFEKYPLIPKRVRLR